MGCQNKLVHTIEQGDDLYHLARHYQTTISAILALNPRIAPYNLQIGNKIEICPGNNFAIQKDFSSTDETKELSLTDGMRLVWEQHIYWTRLLLVSIVERLNDQSFVTARLLKNPADTANIYAIYYTADVAKTIENLLTEHLQIGEKIIIALRDGDFAKSDDLMHQWYANADKLAEAFSSINPHYNREGVRKMLYEHLSLTTKEVETYISGKYHESIMAFDEVESEALKMADYFSDGITKQFPQNFS